MHTENGGGGVSMTSVLNCGLKVSKFKLQSCHYIHFQTNSLGKGMNIFVHTPVIG